MKYLIVIIFSGIFSLAAGQNAYRLMSFSMSVKGSSNLHDWESKVTEVRASGTFTADATSLNSLQALTVEIPAKSIKSTHGSIMDNKTYDALKASSYPYISLKMNSVSKLEQKTDGAHITASCNLTIAGVTNRVDIFAKGKVNPDGSIRFAGSKKIKMTDYKLKPPTALLGTLTTGDEVEIVFSLTLKKA